MNITTRPLDRGRFTAPLCQCLLCESKTSLFTPGRIFQAEAVADDAPITMGQTEVDNEPEQLELWNPPLPIQLRPAVGAESVPTRATDDRREQVVNRSQEQLSLFDPQVLQPDKSTQAIVFTDGACLGNPGPGGYAALILIGDTEQVITGHDPATTNNRMEMTAAIKALESLPAGINATIHSDSQLLIKGMNEWLTGWKAKGWRNASRQPVANRDLWEELDRLASDRLITWQWVKGHAGHEHNERVDGLANAGAKRASEVLM